MADSRPVRLRAEYRDHLDAYTRDVVAMCDRARLGMLRATRALLEQDLEAAEEALNDADSLQELVQRCEERAIALLARQSPVATDLRQVMSYVHIESDLARMGALGKLVAKIARQHHPAAALPPEVAARVFDLAAAVDVLASRVRPLVATPQVEVALSLPELDKTVDTIAQELTALATSDDWPFTHREAVETALIARFYERFADHCVAIGNRIMFMVTGLRPNEYAAQRDAADPDSAAHAERIAVLERRFALREES